MSLERENSKLLNNEPSNFHSLPGKKNIP
jgi:hypothetical protein